MKKYGPASLHQRRFLLGVMKDLIVDSIIDVGYGEGFLLKKIGKIKHVPLFGVGISREALKRARENIPKATFAELDIGKYSNLPFNSRNGFDLVIAADVIEHIYDDKVAIENLKRFSKRYIPISIIQERMRDSKEKWAITEVTERMNWRQN